MGEHMDDDKIDARVMMVIDETGAVGIHTEATLSQLCAFAMFLQHYVMTKFDAVEFEDMTMDDDDDSFKPGGTVQ
jgi:hypothetical protein